MMLMVKENRCMEELITMVDEAFRVLRSLPVYLERKLFYLEGSEQAPEGVPAPNPCLSTKCSGMPLEFFWKIDLNPDSSTISGTVKSHPDSLTRCSLASVN